MAGLEGIAPVWSLLNQKNTCRSQLSSDKYLVLIIKAQQVVSESLQIIQRRIKIFTKSLSEEIKCSNSYFRKKRRRAHFQALVNQDNQSYNRVRLIEAVNQEKARKESHLGNHPRERNAVQNQCSQIMHHRRRRKWPKSKNSKNFSTVWMTRKMKEQLGYKKSNYKIKNIMNSSHR